VILVVSKTVTDLVLSANCPLARIIPVHGGIFPKISFLLRISVEKFYPAVVRDLWDFLALVPSAVGSSVVAKEIGTGTV
jgi:hypothetical protein